MKKDIIGQEYSLTFTVTSEMSAILDGVTIHPVCSTVTMVYYAEVVSRKVIEPYFETGDQAIGGGISLQHLHIAAIGEEVEIRAIITDFNEKVLICSIEARIQGTEIMLCKGTQTQIVLPQIKVDALIEKAYARLSS